MRGSDKKLLTKLPPMIPSIRPGNAGLLTKELWEVQHNAKPAEEITDTESLDEVLSSSTTSMEEWLIDSGATSHMTHSKEFLCHYQKFETPEKVSLGDGHTVTAIGSGEIKVKMRFKVSEQKTCVMKMYCMYLSSHLTYFT